MSAPTLWEEGRMSGERVVRLSVLSCTVLVLLDVAVGEGLGRLFAIGFVIVCVAAALAVRPDDGFWIGVLPPLLLLACSLVLSIVDRGAVARPGDGLVQAVISGLARNGIALGCGYVLALIVLGIRHRVLRRHRRGGAGHSNREGSPAPYRTISGSPVEKSTTVVGDDPHSPHSTTASSQ